MSLLSGMNDILTNKVAMEEAQEMFDFELELALEADELIDTMVDGMANASDFDDEIDKMEDELEEEDEINKEIDSEDNFTNVVGKSANEAAALTGTSFLSSLILDKDDPIKTKAGSVGTEDSAATHKDNFSAEANDNNDPIKTENGSIGADSSANPSNNFSDASKDNNDPINTKNGSIGANATAKDPAVESAMFFGGLLGEEVAMEGVIQKIKDKRAEKKSSKRLENLKLLGISHDVSREEISKLINDGKYDSAKKKVVSFGKELESAKAKIASDDPDASKKNKIADRLIKTNSCLLISVNAAKDEKKLTDSGVDSKTAKKQALSKMKKAEPKTAVESYINECIDMALAFEASVDPEATSDGSIGQDNSKASFNENFSDGKADNNDPIKTKDGSEGQEDSKATFDENFSYGKADNDDPIKSENGSVGQKDSTAKDPVIESAIDELENLNSLLLDDFDDIDDEI